jgi:hypothetical protein
MAQPITELPAHLPAWGRILWARYWHMSERWSA